MVKGSLCQRGLDFGLGEILGIILMPLVVAFLIWYGKRAESKGWIK